MENLPQFNIIDIVVLVVILLGTIRGSVRGLSGELAGLLSAAAALFAGWYFYEPVGAFIVNNTRLQSSGAFLLAFVVLLVTGYVLMLLLRFVLRSIMEFSFKGGIERIGGGLAGFTRYAVLCAAFLLIVGLWPGSGVHSLFAEDSFCGRWTFDTLGPVYEQLAERYPAIRLPATEEESEIDGNRLPGEGEATDDDEADVDHMRGEPQR